MKIYEVRRLIENMPGDSDIHIPRVKSKKERWIEIGIGLVGYLAGFLVIRFLSDGSMAEAIMGGWLIQYIWTRD